MWSVVRRRRSVRLAVNAHAARAGNLAGSLGVPTSAPTQASVARDRCTIVVVGNIILLAIVSVRFPHIRDSMLRTVNTLVGDRRLGRLVESQQLRVLRRETRHL